MKPIHCFAAGTHTAMSGAEVTITAADLAACATAYDPKVHEAPIVIGHPAVDAPAYGWVKALEADAAGNLMATPDQVEPAFAEAVAGGRYKKVSASFWPPKHPANPRPGVWSLRHVGFLGAAAPAVKGLRPVSFADDATGLVEFAWDGDTATRLGRLLRGLRDWMVDKWGREEADKAMDSWLLDSIQESVGQQQFAAPSPEPEPKEEPMPDGKTAADLSAQAAALATRTAELAAREATLQAAEAKARNAEITAFVEGAVKAGKVLPCHQTFLVEFAAGLSPTGEAVCFAAGEPKTSQLAAFQAYLQALPKIVEFGEVAGADRDLPDDAANFAAPPGHTVDASRMVLHQDAQRLMAADKTLTYADALARAGRAKR
ncbi:MAG: peptidase [Alphaproteobacteria bacterium]|nr:peptidase [Alphaproteobacteria bacterium]